MNIRQTRLNLAEESLSGAYRRQPIPAPEEEWRLWVMAQIRAAPQPGIISFPHEERAWWASWLAACAAILLLVGGHVVTSSHQNELLWNLHGNGAHTEWILNMEGYAAR